MDHYSAGPSIFSARRSLTQRATRRKPQRLRSMYDAISARIQYLPNVVDSIEDKHVSFPVISNPSLNILYVLYVPSIRFQVSGLSSRVAVRLDRMAHLWKGPARLAKA